MKIEVYNSGDLSVGIQPYRLSLDLGDIDDLEDKDYREGIRAAASSLGQEITGEDCGAVFEDECWDCFYGSLVEGVCDNQNCISHCEEE